MTPRMLGTLATHGRAALALGAMLIFSGATQADSLSLDINNDAARLTFAHPIADKKMHIDASWLHHQDNGDAIAVGFHITGNAATESRPVNVGLGGRAYFVDSDPADANGSLLALGGFFDAKLPTYDRIGFGGHAYYAPDVLGFGDAEDMLDLSVRVTYSVLREGEIYAGARNFKTDFGSGSTPANRGEVTLDTGFFVGFTLNF